MKIARLIRIVISLFGLFLMQNCGPGECEPHTPIHTTYNINIADKSKIPFSGTDTLVYFNTDADTAIFLGQGKKEFIEEVPYNRGGDPGCPRIDYNYYEHIEYIFKSDHSILKELIFSAYVDNKKDENALMCLNTIYKNNGYRLKSVNAEPLYKDSVEIKGTIYYGLTVYSGSTKFLYNWKYGFLSLYINDETWKLLK